MADKVVLVVAFFPDFGEQIWRGEISDTELEARECFEIYARDCGLDPKFRRFLHVEI